MYLKFDIFRNRKDSVQMIPTETLDIALIIDFATIVLEKI